jgi:hypothetical protein
MQAVVNEAQREEKCDWNNLTDIPGYILKLQLLM